MGYVTLVVTLLKLVNMTVTYLQQRGLLDAGAKSAIAPLLLQGLEIVKDAQEVRNTVTTDNVGEQLDWLQSPDKRRPHDPGAN